MVSSFLPILLFCPLVWSAAIADLNCTNGATAGYTEIAFACDNVQAQAACDLAYENTTPDDYTYTAGDIENRPFQCYTNEDAGEFKQAFKDMAIATCPKQCGYCCETPEYKCANARFPRINCNTITARMCKDPLWRETIAQDCPSRCGFCLLGGCIDAAPDCETQPSICVTRGMEAFVASNCKRTCDQCDSTSNTGTGTTCNTATLTDANSNCVSWVKNGFCNNSFYTAAQKKSYCAKSCGLC